MVWDGFRVVWSVSTDSERINHMRICRNQAGNQMEQYYDEHFFLQYKILFAYLGSPFRQKEIPETCDKYAK